MARLTLAALLEEITQNEQAIGLTGDPNGYHARRLDVLRSEVLEHPDAQAGKDLPPIVGRIG